MRFLKWFATLSPFKVAFPVVLLMAFYQLTESFPIGGFIDQYLRPVVTSLDYKILDFKFLIRDPDLSESQAVLAAIDEKSIGELGRWPWPRNVIARIVENLEKAGAKVIAFDIVFDTEDPSGNLGVMKEILESASVPLSRGKMDKQFFTYLQTKALEADTDARLVETVKQYDNIILGFFWYFNQQEISNIKADFGELGFRVASSLFNPEFTGAPVEVEGKRNFTPSWMQAVGLVTNREALSYAAKHHGYFSTEADADGVFRRVPLLVEFDKTFYPSLALKAASLYLGKEIKASIHVYEEGIADVTSLALEGMPGIPVDSSGKYLLNWRGRKASFPHYTLSDVALGRSTVDQARLDPSTGASNISQVPMSDAFKDKIVIIGATATAVGDIRHTPMDAAYPGPELHLTVIDNILRSNYVKSDSHENKLLFVAALLIFGTLFVIALSKLRALAGSLLLLGTIVGYAFFDYAYLFSQHRLIYPVLVPLMMLSLSYLAVTLFKYMTEERERKRVKGTFEKYVSPAIVHEMLKDPSKLQLKGEKLPLTVLFSDVRGFTTISEKLDAGQVSELLNNYLSPMTDLVFAHDGTLDKYMGDAIMAFWGAPIHFPDHAVKACRCALKMMEKLQEIKKDFKQRGLPIIDVGIGLNTGEMSVGNMGSHKIFSYTVLGDNVNLGSRLEGINKSYGTHIIISEFTYEHVKDHFIAREIDRVRVKGKKLPVKIFELLAEKGAGLQSHQEEAVSKFSNGLNLYYQQKWDQAMREFEEGLKADPQDGPAKAFLERCQYFKDHSPGTDWDGSWVMTSK